MDKYNLSKELCNLVCDLEYIVGNNVCNSTGGEIRYPVTIRDYGKKTNWQVKDHAKDLSNDDVWSMKYIFGANWLSIGSSLIKVLDELENRYNIDFDELERKRLETALDEEHE